MFMLIEWVEDPPTWDVLPVKKVIYGEIEVGNVCDVEYLEESSPARIIELGSRNTLLKALGKLERDRAGGPTTTSGPSGRGQREKRPPAPYSPGGTTSDNDECVPMKRKKKERESSSKKILMEYYVSVHIGPSTSITQHQYGSIKWFNAKKATKDLLLAVFGRSILASHSYTGKQSNAFRTKAAKPQLNPVKVSDIINYITKRFGVDQGEVKKAISEKCADQEKMEKRRTH
ncbi:early boundary activity protein 2-like [Alosa sapidissima]|uniref:early boundary activity protein 2-like n=1 Tax=Alosa sapidissima TaxID=34773 RepID=UPI001C08B121|nr:early boundary activity protein 2-like [Alosa sapidissima]